MGTFVLRAAAHADVDLQYGDATDAATSSGDAASDLANTGGGSLICGGAGARDFRVRVVPSFFLDGAGAATPMASLPAGFTVLTAGLQLLLDATLGGGTEAFVNANSDAAVQFGEIDETVIERSGASTIPSTVAWPSTIATRPALFLHNDGLGFRFSTPGGVSLDVDRLIITGNYEIRSWWFNSATLEYAYYPVAPSAAWTAAENPPNIREESVIAEGASYTEALALATSILAARGKAEVSAKWKCRDEDARPGRTQHIALPSPTSVFGDFKIQQVTISDFSMNPDLCPTFSVLAAPVRHSLEDLLRMRRG